MSLNELTSASCINIMLTKWVQVSIPLLNLSVLCFFTTLENLERLINPNICAKILILDLDMVFVLVSNPKLGKTLPCPFFILDACEIPHSQSTVIKNEAFLGLAVGYFVVDNLDIGLG